MDKQAARDKRTKNLSFKPRKDKRSEPEKRIQYEPASKSEETLPNNWTRYEIGENDEPEGANFETLLQEPVCNDSHFKFKSEQNWDTDIKSQLEFNKYFTLDLKLLGGGISTVPFPKRHNYDEKLFTLVELESIKRNSEINQQKYKKFLETKRNTNKIKVNAEIEQKPTYSIVTIDSNDETSECENEVIDKKVEDVSKEIEQQKVITSTNIEDDVDELLNLKPQQKKLEKKVEDHPKENDLQNVTAPENTADLEKWLDDILDD